MRLRRSSDQGHLRRTWLGLLRAIVLGVLVLVATTAVSLRRADAHLGESLIAFGDQFSAFAGGKANSNVGHLAINGVVLHRVTASTPLGIDEAFDRLTRVCTEKGGVEGAEKLLAETLPGTRVSTRTLLDGVYRHEANGAGVLACIDTGRPLPLTEGVCAGAHRTRLARHRGQLFNPRGPPGRATHRGSDEGDPCGNDDCHYR